jgi:methionyl-tRNA formyltransferase
MEVRTGREGQAGGREPIPGQVMEASKERLVVACGGGTRLEILELRFSGHRVMPPRDAFIGRFVRAGDRFTPPSP